MAKYFGISSAIFMLVIFNLTCGSKVTLRDNGYEGVVVALEDGLPSKYCQEIVLGFQSLISYASNVVFEATRRRASFRDLTIKVPSSWTPSACPVLQGKLQVASHETWDSADFRVTMARHPIYGSRPWTLQSKGCAQNGDYISLGHEILFQNQTEINSRLLANAWLKYRYGVFEEIGIEGSTTHPTTYRNSQGDWVATACTKHALHSKPSCDINDLTCSEDVPTLTAKDSTIKQSFMAFPEESSITELCDEGTHNSVAPTPQNLICGSTSVWEVLRASPDFQNNRNVEGLARAADIKVKFVRAPEPKMVLLVEDTNVMNVQKRWDFMRKAVRKLVVYDVPDGLSVGLVVFDSKATVKYPLKPLSDDGSRFNLGSSLPRNPSKIDKHRRCVSCGLEESIRLLKSAGDTAGGHIVLMMAGSGRMDSNEIFKVEKLLHNTNIILHVIVYPLTEKFPEPGSGIKALGSRTGGLTFTIPDEGIGADSKINMYYNLLDSLYHTVSAAAGKDVLPVKVHSAEHKGGVSLSEGSFWVDPGLGEDTVFAIFYYDIAHVGDTIHLISPHGQVIDTGNMQNEDDNINMITVRLRKNQESHGLWHYKLENRADSHQAIFVQVTSRSQKTKDSPNVMVRTWTNHIDGQVNITDISRPLIVYTEARIGLAPVEEAKIKVVLKKLGVTSNGTEYDPLEINLVDNGLLSPDIKRGDAVYSRFINGLSIGKYNVIVYVQGQINQFKFTRQLRLGIIDVFGTMPEHDVIAPSRITNLRTSILPGTNGKVSLAWTAPGDDYDFGTANKYKVIVNKDILRLRDETGDILENWPAPQSALSIQQHTISWDQYDSVFYLAMYAIDESSNSGRLSNIVEIYVPAPTTPSPLTIVTLPNKLLDGAAVTDSAGAPMFGGFDNLIIVAIVIFLLVIVASLCLACYCYSTKKKSKLIPEKHSEPKDTFNVTVTVGNKASDFLQEKHGLSDGLKKDYLRPINSWSPTELLGHHDKRGSLADNISDHSGSTKKSYGESSEPPQYYSNGVHYSYEANSYNESYPHEEYQATPVHEGYAQSSSSYPTPTEGYVVEGYPPRPYSSSQPTTDSLMSESVDGLPGSQGPPGYSVYPYDNSIARNNSKVPPPIPPKPKVQYAPEPYTYDSQDLTGNNSSSSCSLTSEKRVRNVTMV